MPSNDLQLDPERATYLPFEEDRQAAFMGHVIKNEGFYKQVKDRIQPQWIKEPYVRDLFAAYIEFHREFGRMPTKEELLGHSSLRFRNAPDHMKFLKVYDLCCLQALKYGEDVISRELTDWLRCRIYHDSVSESAKLFNQKQVNKAVVVLEKAVKDFQTTRFDGQPPADFSNAKDLVDAQTQDQENALTTGSPLLDSKIVSDPTKPIKGCMLPGDTTVLIAPVNIGKTTTMITIARHNFDAEKDVLFISLEGRQLDIMEKFYCSYLRVSKARFREMTLADHPDVDKAQTKMSKHLTYLSMNKPLLTVEEVIGVIRTHQMRKRAQTGKGFDLLVVDYPQILTTEMARSGMLEVRQIQDYVYRQFVQLALEEKFHALLAAQTNREGSKINRSTGSDSRLLTFEYVSEAFAIAMSATNIITVNRSPQDMAANRITFYVCKSRSSEIGWAVVCRSDFGHALTHAPDMLSTCYRGSDTMPQRIEGLLEQFKDKEVPFGALQDKIA